MTQLWTIAALTIKEAVRRRIFIASILISLIFVLWAFMPFPVRHRDMMGDDPGAAQNTMGRIFAWLGCGMIKFFSSILAISLAAGAITNEVDKGVLSVIVPKPLSRAAIYLGKWLGILVILAANVAVWAGLLVFVIWHHTGTFHAGILTGVLAASLFPLLFATLTLFFSTFASSGLSMGLALISAGIALAQDILASLSNAFSVPLLMTVSNIVGYIVPIGKMNHWITRGLGDAGFDLTSFGSPGAVAVSTNAADLVYICAYILVTLLAGMYLFQRRDL